MRLATVVVAALAVTAIFFYQFMVFRNMGNQYRYYTVVAFALPWLFLFNSRSRIDRWIGELSFPVYLVHWPLLTFIPWLFGSALPPPWASLVDIVATLVCAVALLRLVVVPVDRWRAKRAKSTTPIMRLEQRARGTAISVPLPVVLTMRPAVGNDPWIDKRLSKDL